MSQYELLIEHLNAGHTITPLEALRNYGIFRLGARIYDLKRPPYNMDIEAEMVEVENKKRVAQYRKVSNE